MILDFTENGAMKVDMVYYIKGMLKEFPYPMLLRHHKTASYNFYDAVEAFTD
jgi:hypothetical protein